MSLGQKNGNEHRHMEEWGRVLLSTACVENQVCVNSTFPVMVSQEICTAAGQAGPEKDEPGSTQEPGDGAQPCFSLCPTVAPTSRFQIEHPTPNMVNPKLRNKRLPMPVHLCNSKASFSACHVKFFASLNVCGITTCPSSCILLPGFVLFR